LYWWREVLITLGIYIVYSFVRNTNEGSTTTAFRHAKDVIRWQKAIGINVEETLQDWALNARPLIIAMNYIYGSLHFIITAGVIVYLFRKQSDDYPRWRNTLAVMTVFALIGFITWPLMPPRLLPESYSFVDTLARYPTFWTFNSGAMQEVSNQYAAMPSLHFGWAMFCVCSTVPHIRRRGWRIAMMAYPGLTLTAIVLTGNHYILDAVAGAIVFGLAYLVSQRFTAAGRPRLRLVGR